MGSNAKKDTPFGRADFLRLTEEQYGTGQSTSGGPPPTTPCSATRKPKVVRRADAGVPGKAGACRAGPVDIVGPEVRPGPGWVPEAGAKILPGYHMHKGNWITLVLDGSVEEETVRFLLDRSHSPHRPGRRHKAAGGRPDVAHPRQPQVLRCGGRLCRPGHHPLEAEQPGGRG